MKSRTKARGIALQVLYEFDLTGHSPALSIDQRLIDESMEEKQKVFSQEIIAGVVPIILQLDQIIARNAPDWPLDQVATIDRNIIRIALWEFAVEQCTPVKVAINEAIELAKVYGSDSTPRFVNGVLGSLAARIVEIHNAFKDKQQESAQ
jgi:transcription antitermination protein NusB